MLKLKRANKIFTIILVLVTLTFAWITLLPTNDVKAAATLDNDMPVVFIDPLNVTANPGETFTIAMTIFNLSNNHHLASEQWAPGDPLPPADSRFNYSLGNLYALDIQFSWDPTLLDYVSHTVKIPVEEYADGVLHEPIFDFMDYVNNVDGTYWLAKSSSIPAVAFNAPNANVTVFEMTFNVKKIGKGVFNITTSKLAIPTSLPGHAYANYAIPHHVRHGNFQSELSAIRIETLKVGVEVGNLSFDPPLISGENALVKVKLINEGDTLDTFNLTLFSGTTILETWINEVLEGGESRTYNTTIEASAFTLGANSVTAEAASTVLTSYNLTEELSKEFMVLGMPDIDIDGPSSAKTGEEIEFSALGGHTGGEILNYTWKIFAPNDDTPMQTRYGADVTFKLNIKWIGGNWTVVLSVKDDNGMTYNRDRPASSAWRTTKILEVTALTDPEFFSDPENVAVTLIFIVIIALTGIYYVRRNR